MYLFVFIWVPSLQETTYDSTSLPLGYIFSAFMVSMMLGSLLYTFITTHWHQPPPAKAAGHVSGSTATTDTTLTLHAKLSSLLCAVSSLAFAVCMNAGAGSGPQSEHIRFWSFCAFEVCVGMYYPVQGMLRSTLIANEHRATVRPAIPAHSIWRG